MQSKRDAALQRYLDGAGKTVQGWLNDKSARMIAELSLHQRKEGLNGAIGEIGVHHGRLFILMALASREEDGAVAVDVFDQQQLNVDRSGRGNRAIFERNLRTHGIDPAAVRIMASSSLDIDAEDLLRAAGPLRLLSVDGGHTPECIVNDMRLADVALADHGVAIIDDVFNSTWPGVVTGLSEYLRHSPRIIPFATSPNKVYGCAETHVDHYRAFFRATFASDYDRSDRFFGFPVDGYGARDRRRPSMRRRIWRGLARRISTATGS